MVPAARVAMFSAWTLNPYQDLLVRELRALGLDVDERPFAALAATREPELAAIHVHGLPFRVAADRPSLRRAATVLRRLVQLRRAGTRVVWTPHDFCSHRAGSRSRARLDRLARDVVARVANALHVHSEHERAWWRQAGVPDGKLVLAAHGHYIGCYPDAIGADAARAALGLDRRDLVFGFFGWLRRNKGLLDLLAAFAHLDDESARLVIAGSPEDAAIADAVARAAERDARIVARLGPVPADEVQLYLRAADAMVLPYHATVATSGAAVLAASFGRACIATRAANLDALLAAETNLLVPCGDPQALLDALRLAGKQRDALAAHGAANRRRVARDAWSATAAILRTAYLGD